MASISTLIQYDLLIYMLILKSFDCTIAIEVCTDTLYPKTCDEREIELIHPNYMSTI